MNQSTKRALLVDGNGIPIGCVIVGANCHDSPLLAPTLEKLSRFGGTGGWLRRPCVLRRQGCDLTHGGLYAYEL